MREVDTKQSESDYAASKYPEYYSWLDVEARNMFHQGVGAGTLKCVTRYNHHGYRDKRINTRLVEDRYPRCQQSKLWKHVILCGFITLMRNKYI